MRRISVLAVMTAIAVAAVGVARADDGPGPGNGSPPFPFVVGAGTVLSASGDAEHITLSAHLGPNGPTGHYSFRFDTGERFQGEVTCMIVSGNRAVAGGPLSEPFTIGGEVFENAGVFVEDNGEGGPIPDRAVGVIFLPLTFTRICNPTTILPVPLPGFPLDTGNFVVNG